MALNIKGNGRLIALWLVATLVLAMIGGSVTGALVGGPYPGYVVGAICAGSAMGLWTKLSGQAKKEG
jgi:hypothetical protein